MSLKKQSATRKSEQKYTFGISPKISYPLSHNLHIGHINLVICKKMHYLEMLFDDNSIPNFSLDSFIVSNITEANSIPL